MVDVKWLDDELVPGLAALLESSILDRYFRVLSGNAQVVATGVRAIPLPDEASIPTIGMSFGSNSIKRPCVPKSVC